MARLAAALAASAALLCAASTAHALPSCYGAQWGEDCDAYFWSDTMGDVAVSRTTVEPGGLLTVTATSGSMAPYWSRTDTGYHPSGVGAVTIRGPGTVVSHSPTAADDLQITPSTHEVAFAGVELNPPNHGVPTSKFGTGTTFTVTFRVPRSGTTGRHPVEAAYSGNRGYVGWGDSARRYVTINFLPDVRLSGHLRQTVCDPQCHDEPVAGEVVSVSGTSDIDDPVSRSSEPSGADGAWSVEVPRGTYVVTPPNEMEPASRDVVVTGDVGGLDFLRPPPLRPLPDPDPVPPPVEQEDEEIPGAGPCVVMCLPKPEVLKARFATAGDGAGRRGSKGRRKRKGKRRRGGPRARRAAQTSGPAKVRVLVRGTPRVQYGVHLVEGTTCSASRRIGGRLRSLTNFAVTTNADGKVRATRRVSIGSGRIVSAYVTDGRDRSPYADCRRVRGGG